jgi:hypothetical protein
MKQLCLIGGAMQEAACKQAGNIRPQTADKVLAIGGDF